MALPDSFVVTPGTAVIWGTPSGSGVTNNLTLDALADGSGRMGVYADLGANFAEEYSVMLIVETGTAAVAGKTVELYLACTDNTARWPGKVDGTDAAYPTVVANNKLLLGEPACVLKSTTDANTALIQSPVIWRPTARYVAPVVINSLGQAFRDETTASDNDSRVILVPRAYQIVD